MRHLDRNAKIRHLKRNWILVKELQSFSKFTVNAQDLEQYDNCRTGRVLSVLEELDCLESWRNTTPKRYTTGSLDFEKAERLVREVEP